MRFFRHALPRGNHGADRGSIIVGCAPRTTKSLATERKVPECAARTLRPFNPESPLTDREFQQALHKSGSEVGTGSLVRQKKLGRKNFIGPIKLA